MVTAGPARPTRRARPVRPVGLAALAIALVGALAACIPSSVDPPAGDGPLRYRDVVFDAVTRTVDLPYGRAPGRDGQPQVLRLDLYRPTGDTVTARPAIVWAHGGGFIGGNKADERGLVETFARRGFVVVSIEYRLLAPGGGCSGATVDACTAAAEEATADGKAAVRWLRANATTYGIDPTRIAFGGFSAGAVMATAVGTSAETPGDSGNPGYSSRVGAWISAAGGLPYGIGVDADDSPGYLFHGTADTTVPYQWAKDTADALSAAGVRVVLRPVQGGGHSMPDGTTFTTQSANFLYRELDLAHAAR